MRTDWPLNDDGVLDGGSDWFSRIWAKSEMEELTEDSISRGAFCCACSVNFSLIRETAGMRLRRFPA